MIADVKCSEVTTLLISIPNDVWIRSMASSFRLIHDDNNLMVVDFAPNFSNQHNL